jgi:hypothetical protein
MFNFRFFQLSAFVLFVVVQAFAHSARADVMPATSSGNVTTYGAGVMSAADLARSVISRASDSSLQVQKSIDLVVDGRAATVTGISKPLPVNYAKAVTNFARGAGGAALKAAGAVYAAGEVAKALWDLCNDLGYRCSKGSDGSPVVEKTDPTVCTVGPCYEYQIQNGSATSPWFTTRSATCDWLVGALRSTNPSYPFVVLPYPSNTNPSGVCNWTAVAGYPNSRNWSYRTVSPSVSAYQPSTIQELEDAIASESGWPSGSSLPEVVRQSVASGYPLPVPAPTTITGPASVPGPTSTKTTPAQNGNPAKTVTTSTTTNITYEGNKVTTNNITTTVTQTTNNGVPETTTETEETEPEATPTDSVNPDLPKLYERKYPDGLTGVWTTRKAELMATSLPNLIGSLSPTITGSGGCPQFSIPLDIGPWHWGTYNLGPSCAVWEFIKWCVLIGAAFLVRALVFGG